MREIVQSSNFIAINYQIGLPNELTHQLCSLLNFGIN
jgi:hypothetical protein